MICLQAPSPWKCGPLSFDAGEYFVEASTAATALHCNADVRVASIKNPKPWRELKDWNGKSILICRSGGFGDLLFLTPLIRAIRARWPMASISVATTTYYREALADHPLIDTIIPYPLKSVTALKYDTLLWFEGLIEWDPRGRLLNSVDLHSAFAGLELTEGKEMDYYAHERHVEAMRRRFPRPEGPRIGVQLSASARARTYPAPLMGLLLENMANYLAPLKGQIVLFDAPRPHESAEGIDPILLSLPTEKPALSFAESAAVLSDCTAVIAPDSALCHVAGALHIPTIALYGPFPSKLRTAYAPTIQAIDGHAPCAPCFWHDRESIWPQDKPCSKSGRCEALANIAPRQIMKRLKEMMEEILCVK